MNPYKALKHIERINEVLSAVGRLDGINNLQLGPDGAAKLRLAGGYEVFFEYCEISGKFFVYTPLLPMPLDGEKRSALMQHFLSANFLKLRSGEGEYAIAASQNSIVYQISLSLTTLDVACLDKSIDVLLREHEDAPILLHGQEKVLRGTQSGFKQALLKKAMGITAMADADRS